MRYQNPLPDEPVNYSKEHPLKEFTQLLIGVGVVIFVVVAALNFFASTLAHFIPFEYEKSMVKNVGYLTPKLTDRQQELQALADRMSAHMEMPQEMQITVHHDSGETVNAFATLGGHVVFFDGLMTKLDTDQQLAAVMAHEIAHVKLRHPIVATGKGLTLATLAAFFSGTSGSGAGDWLIGNTINFHMLQYSREQELAADEWAARALYREYGDIFGAKSLFEVFSQLETDSLDSKFNVELMRSHPYSKNRWAALEKIAAQEAWPIQTSGKPPN